MASKPRVLVLGGCGFVGRNFVTFLVQNDLASKIRVADKVRFPSRAHALMERLSTAAAKGDAGHGVHGARPRSGIPEPARRVQAGKPNERRLGRQGANLLCIALSAFVRKRAEIDALARMRTSKRTRTTHDARRTHERQNAWAQGCVPASVSVRVFFFRWNHVRVISIGTHDAEGLMS